MYSWRFHFKHLAICLILMSGMAFVISIVKEVAAQSVVPTPVSPIVPAIPNGIPVALWQTQIPRENPMTAEKVALGKMLFFDKRLSADGTVSCATCHDPATALTNRNSVAIGISNQSGTRNAPTILNAMFSRRLFWDGRTESLEEQAKVPLLSATEMGMTRPADLVVRLVGVAEYRHAFRRVFAAEGITVDTIAKAIAAFERTQLSGNSPFDRFMAGDQQALSESQKRGWMLFRSKAQCITCHPYKSESPFFTDNKFHNTGIAAINANYAKVTDRAREFSSGDRHAILDPLRGMEAFSELGRYVITGKMKDLGAFKTPSLRDVELTGPYMHTGSLTSLTDVVRRYNKGSFSYVNPAEFQKPLGLTESEIRDVVAFLLALTSDDTLQMVQNAQNQKAPSVKMVRVR